MNIQEQFTKAFGLKPNTIQSVNSRRLTGVSTTTTSSNGTNISTYSGSGSLGAYGSLNVPQFGQVFNQPLSGASSGSFVSKPIIPFQLLDGLEKATLIKQFLIERGVERINEETAKALFLVSCVLKDQVLPPVKHAKKKLII